MAKHRLTEQGSVDQSVDLGRLFIACRNRDMHDNCSLSAQVKVSKVVRVRVRVRARARARVRVRVLVRVRVRVRVRARAFPGAVRGERIQCI